MLLSAVAVFAPLKDMTVHGLQRLQNFLAVVVTVHAYAPGGDPDGDSHRGTLHRSRPDDG